MPSESRFSLDIPQIVHGVQDDYRRLYYSEPLAALKVPVTIMAGYGLLKNGTALAKNLSAAGKAGLLLPYNPTTFTGVEDHPGRAYLVANSGTTDKFVYVSMDDSYKFNVGDDLIINDDTTAAALSGEAAADLHDQRRRTRAGVDGDQPVFVGPGRFQLEQPPQRAGGIEA